MFFSLVPQGVDAEAEDAAAGNAIFAEARNALASREHLRHPKLRAAADLLGKNALDAAAQLLSDFLRHRPRDAQALFLNGECAMRRERFDEAEALFAQGIALTPEFDGARFSYAMALFQLSKLSAANEQLSVLLKKHPGNPLFRDLEADICSKMGKFEEALAVRRQLASDYPELTKVWISYGRALRALGRRDECIATFRKAAELRPWLGDAYLSLAKLKTFRFTAAEREQMEAQLARSDLSAQNRAAIHHALGKVFDDLELWGKAFDHYARASAILRLGSEYDPGTTAARVARCKALLTSEFFRDRDGAGCGADDPIFIVGMQRAGSTLVEQILGSHSAIEASGELADIGILARELHDASQPDYFTALPGLDSGYFRKFGENYIENTRSRRKSRRPFFTDKQPYNFWHIGLIHLALPNAKIIDVRRHPMACCFSNFTQHFADASAAFTQRQTDLGQFYRDHVELMAHYERVRPGRIYRVIYERLVEDPEGEVRRLLEHLGLPFEKSCLEFHKNERAFDSISSEQVRSPLFREGIDRWRHYEPWLGPLKAALGPVLDSYPEVPEFPL